MNSRRILSSESLFVKRLRNGAGKYWNVIVQIGPEAEKYSFLLFPLVTQSAYFKRRIEPCFEQHRDGSPLVVNLPDFPYRVEIFKMVQDFCCAGMEENDICIANVVELFAVSEYLEMKNLKCMVSNFLEREILISGEKCLAVLATFDGIDENVLFERCKDAFLRMVRIQLASSEWRAMGYNVNHFVRIAEFLPTSVAERIYASFGGEQCTYDFVLYFVLEVEKRSSNVPCCMLNRSHPLPDADPSRCQPVRVELFPGDTGALVSALERWMEDLPRLLPDLSKRSLLISHLAKLMHLETHVKAPNASLKLELCFICGLLVQATELISMDESGSIAPGLVGEIIYLEMCVSEGLHQLKDFGANQQDHLVGLLMKFKFGTLLSIVRHFCSLSSDDLTIGRVAMILDVCLAQHLKSKSLTGKQIVLIYQEVPNDKRRSHGELYQLFQDALRDKDISSQEALKLTCLLDYNKLSDEIIENIFEEFQLDCGPRFVERFLAMQRAKRIDKEKIEQKLIKLRADLSKAESERDSLREGSRLAQSLQHDLEKEKEKTSRLDAILHDLEVEKEKTICQICFSRPRNSLCLPCMHFLYCAECLEHHHRQKKSCPTCRCFIAGVLKCSLSV